MNSIWTETTKLRSFPSLNSDAKTDVLIIGGGISGILCAYMLAQAGIDYMLVEADCICSGVTKNTTAKLTAQHGLIYSRLIREFGPKTAALYLRCNQNALAQYRQLCQHIDCDFETKDAFVYSLINKDRLEKELKALDRIGFPAEYVSEIPLPMPTAGAIRFPNQAQFHPLKFIHAVSDSLKIYEHTKVTELCGNIAKTDHGKITAERIVVATHFPIFNKHGGYFLKIYQSRSYVLALENASDVKGMYIDEAPNGLSFRNADNLLLIGGGGHRTGESGGNWSELSDFAKQTYPGAIEKLHWAAQDCMTLDALPYIGPYRKGSKNMYVITGFNKWGMTCAMAGALLIKDLLLGNSSEFASLFDPHRTSLRPQLIVNIAKATKNLASFSTKRCPHMGCALKWNSDEHSWDCPCHGSRFTKDGELIDNPAADDLR